VSDTVRIERHRAWHEPTQAQKRAGNYAKRKILWRGLQLAIENEAGSVRTFLNPDGSVGEKRLIYPYGYVCCSTGADGDEVDVFVGQDLDAPLVFIIRAQAKGRWDQYDEDKVMIGFSSSRTPSRPSCAITTIPASSARSCPCWSMNSCRRCAPPPRLRPRCSSLLSCVPGGVSHALEGFCRSGPDRVPSGAGPRTPSPDGPEADPGDRRDGLESCPTGATACATAMPLRRSASSAIPRRRDRHGQHAGRARRRMRQAADPTKVRAACRRVFRRTHHHRPAQPLPAAVQGSGLRLAALPRAGAQRGLVGQSRALTAAQTVTSPVADPMLNSLQHPALDGAQVLPAGVGAVPRGGRGHRHGQAPGGRDRRQSLGEPGSRDPRIRDQGLAAGLAARAARPAKAEAIAKTATIGGSSPRQGVVATDELPPTWGHYSVDGRGLNCSVKAPKLPNEHVDGVRPFLACADPPGRAARRGGAARRVSAETLAIRARGEGRGRGAQ
jgi:hypothetical protein